jgi:hypothetical protein
MVANLKLSPAVPWLLPATALWLWLFWLYSGGKVHAAFGFTGVPALVVLDRMGRVRLTREGYNASETNFRRDLVQFLKTL